MTNWRILPDNWDLLKKKQMEILGLENITTEMCILIDKLNNRLEDWT